MRFCLIAFVFLSSPGKSWLFTPYAHVTNIEPHPDLPIVVLGTSDGEISLVDASHTNGIEIRRLSVGSSEVIESKWNPLLTSVLATVCEENRLVVRRFSDMSTLASTQSQLLRHPQPLLSVSWDGSSGTRLVVGTALGSVEVFTASFEGISGASNTGIHPIADRVSQWFIGCRTSFVYYVSSTQIIAGCDEGELWSISVTEPKPVANITLPSSSADPSPRALFVEARGYVVSFFENTVHVIDAVNFELVKSFKIRPARGHYYSNLGEKRVLSIAVSFHSNANLDKLIVRTTEGVIFYDLTGILDESIPTSSWLNDTSLSDLITVHGGQLISSVLRYGDLTNDPSVELNTTTGSLDVTACRNAEAVYKINEEKTDVHCTFGTPLVGVDIVLPFSFSHLEGEFKLKSTGAIPATDCSAMKAPIIDWSADQKNQWVYVMPSTRIALNHATCPAISDTPMSGPAWTLEECKQACVDRPECNMVYVKYRSDIPGAVEVCTFHRCESPENAPAPSARFEEIWTLTSAYRSWVRDRSKPLLSYNGYVAFGTEERVIHGGCAGPNGLIPTGNGLTVPVVPTSFAGEGSSVLRVHVSQYNAEAHVRLSEFSLNILKNYTDYASFYEEPSSAAGGYLIAIPLERGGPNGPVAWTSRGVLITTSDTSVALINN